MGFARSAMDDKKFRDYLAPYLRKADISDSDVQKFLSRIFYFSGAYDSVDSFLKLEIRLIELEDNATSNLSYCNRLFYFAIPPNVFIPVASTIKTCAISKRGWNRLIVEKPFGHDLESARVLAESLGAIYNEDQIYRIDHYLGELWV